MSWAELDSVEQAAGAEFTDFQGVRLPKSFGSPTREWEAIRTSAGLLDGRNRQILAVTGSDRSRFLQGMLSNDVAELTDGEGVYATFLSAQGRLVSDLYVYALADHLLLDVPAARAQAVQETLERYIIADDVEFVDPTAEAVMALEGPRAQSLLALVADRRFDDLAPCHHRVLNIDGVALRCVAVGQGGETGFRLLAPARSAATVWTRLTANGAVPVGLDALNVLRLEAGIPWHGVDMHADTLVMEVGLDRAISREKGCYLGQEVVERVNARGRINHRLCGLTGNGQQVPPPSAALTHNGKEVGSITSAAMSPALGAAIALGYVERRVFEPGTVVDAMAGDLQLSFTVTTLPFYHPSSRTT